jgi:uncharacterized protein
MKKIFIAALGLCLIGCSEGNLDFLGRSFGFYQPQLEVMTSDLTDRVIVPGYQNFVNSANTLRFQLENLSANPSPEKLNTARQAWKDAAQAWAQTEAFQFGPANDERLIAKIDYWPKRVDDLEAVLTGKETLEAKNLGATRRGLPALEYLLFGPESDVLSQTESMQTHRMVYLKSLGWALNEDAEALLSAWNKPKQGYSQTYKHDPAARNLQLNQWVLLFENNKDKRLGAAAGVSDSSKNGKELLEAPECQCSKELLRATMTGFADSFWGPEGGRGMDDVLIELGQRTLLNKIQAQYNAIYEHIQAIPNSLEQNLSENPEHVQKLIQSMSDLLRLIKVDLANALNETVHFSANDGD